MGEPPLFREPLMPETSPHTSHPTRTPSRDGAANNGGGTPAPTTEEGRQRLLRSPAGGIPPVITTREDLVEIASRLRASHEPVAIDTERAQGYRYGGGAYLVQIRKENVGTFLIDPRAFTTLSALAPALAETWILHAADQDLLCLRDIGLEPTSIFDTEIAARLVGYTRFSLGALTEQILGITLEKSHQNEDWSLRPLPVDWLRYAALDVELLPALHSTLSSLLADAGRSEWARQEFAHDLTHPLLPRDHGWRDLKGLGKIRTRRGLAIARELWKVREELGKELDVSPGRILATDGIVAAALVAPTTRRGLTSLEQFRRARARKHMDLWWSAISKARSLPDDALPPLKVPPNPHYVPPANLWRRNNPEAWERLQTMRHLAEKAAEPLGLQAEVVLEPRTQREVAWTPLPGDLGEALTRAGARPWQVEHITRVTSPQISKRLGRGS